MPRILFISHVPSAGGPNTSLIKLLQHIRDEYDVAVLVRAEGPFTETLRQHGIRYHLNPLRLRYLPQLIRLIRTENYDLMYANSVYYTTLVALLAAWLIRRPYIWHVREILTDSTFSGAFDRCLTRYFLRRARHVIAVSQDVERHVRQFQPHVRQVSVVYNGTDVDDFALEPAAARQSVITELGLPADMRIIVNVGTFAAHKNQLDTLAIFARINPAQYPACLLLLGDTTVSPDYTRQVRESIIQHDVEPYVRLVGFRPDINRFLCAAELQIHTAVRDSHPRSVLEGMAAGLPVMAYPTNGVAETVIDQVTGFLVPAHDIDSAAARLQMLLQQPALRQQMGQQARERIQTNFTSQQTAQQIQAILDAVLAVVR